MKASSSTDLSLLRLYRRDQGDVPAPLRWLFSAPPSAVVQPRTEEEAIDAVREAYAGGAPIVPRAGGSTAFGQSVPAHGGLVLDACFLKSIRAFEADTVTVDAGVRWSDLSAFLAERGQALGSYPSSWYSTVGGWVQTGGCGMLTHRFGALREQVTRLKVCAADGKVLELVSGQPDFDVFFETEGQLGLVLRVTLRVRPLPEEEYPLAVECKDQADAWKLYAQARAEFAPLVHASVFNAERMRHFNHTFQARMQAKGSSAGGRGLVSGSPAALFYVESLDDWRALRNWVRGRGATEAPAHVGSYLWAERFYPLKGKRAEQSFLGNELVVPDAQAPAYAQAAEKLAGRHGSALAIEANAAGKGESVVIASLYAEGSAAVLALLPLVFGLDRLGLDGHQARLYQVGAYNAPFADRKFTARRLDELLAAKGRLDPKGLFNPGKSLDFRTRWTRRLSPARHVRLARRLVRFFERRTWIAPALARLAMLAAQVVPSRARKDAVAKAALECVNCGFCLPVCPAYLVSRDERTTARGKLGLGLAGARGAKLSAKDVELLHSCMHCGACTAVCQSAIELVTVWPELEARAAAAAGARPTAAIEAFVQSVEASADYTRLLRRGYMVERDSGEPPSSPSPAVGAGPVGGSR